MFIFRRPFAAVLAALAIASLFARCAA